jgi:hypothetical protein
MPFLQMVETPFNDSSKDLYCFYEDEFDNYLASIPEEQVRN